MTNDEKAFLQRRIKNQRWQLRRLNERLKFLTLVNERLNSNARLERVNTYRHAATLAETFWFVRGKRIANCIRRWM